MRSLLLMVAVLCGLCVTQAEATDRCDRESFRRSNFSSHDRLSDREERLLRQLERERDIDRELELRRLGLNGRHDHDDRARFSSREFVVRREVQRDGDIIGITNFGNEVFLGNVRRNNRGPNLAIRLF